MTEDRCGEYVVAKLRHTGAPQERTKTSTPISSSRTGSRRSSARSWSGSGGVLPLGMLRLFDEHELELAIGGMSEIDMDDWTRFTYYCGYEIADQVIEWF